MTDDRHPLTAVRQSVETLSSRKAPISVNRSHAHDAETEDAQSNDKQPEVLFGSGHDQSDNRNNGPDRELNPNAAIC